MTGRFVIGKGYPQVHHIQVLMIMKLVMVMTILIDYFMTYLDMYNMMQGMKKG